MLVFFLLVSTVFSIPCLDSNGNPVDWWFTILLPSATQKWGTIYADANTPGSFVNGMINSNSNNAIQNTVTQIGLYGGNVDSSSVGWLMWNDETYVDITGKPVNHEQDSNGNYYGHSKGLLGFDGSTGFWLTHSSPGFPYSHNITPSSWSFNYRQTYFAQHFFCSTYNTASQLSSITNFLSSYYIYVYDSNVPSFSVPSAFNNLINGQYTTGTSSLNYRTQGNLPFIGFGKNGQTGSDIWEDYVAPGLGVGLNVESWCGGYFPDSSGCQPSDCAGAPIVNPSVPQQGQSNYAYDSVCITSLDFGNGNSFKTSHNHAKFALSTQPAWVCMADNNRQVTQRQRGGGSICFKHSAFYNLLNSGIAGLNATCPSNSLSMYI